MTLRHRLQLVYGIVVLLSTATVGAALYELQRARQVIGALQYFNEIVLNAEKMKGVFSEASPNPPNEFNGMLAAAALTLTRASDYADVDPVREALNRVRRLYNVSENEKRPPVEDIREALSIYADLAAEDLKKYTAEAQKQDVHTWALSGVVITLTILHVAVIGSLLRRWLLRPMQQLNRQVEALGRDQPPAEPLLTSPQEMAVLAHALDEARQSLGSLRQKLIESERLTTIGQFAAQLTHNLRNPLASIRAAAQVTARHEDADSASGVRMTEIMASVDRLNQWIEGLMEVARRDPTPTRRTDVVPLLRRVQQAMSPELTAKDLTLSIEVPPDGLMCAHDTATLEHALIAMIVNAIEASPLGSTIVLRGQSVSTNGDSTAVCRISVEDRGPGLPQDVPERIFEFSYSTKQRGMGLGLALARLALQRQGGSAHAHNNPEGGAIVYVELPSK